MDQATKRDNEQKKQYLRQYKSAMIAEQVILDEIQKVRMDAMFPSIVQDDGMPHGSGRNGDLSDLMVRVEELQAELKEQLEKRIKLRQDITRKIEQMNDETEKAVLRLRYIQALKWEEIAVQLNYNYRYTLKIHGEALKNFKM